MGNTEWLPVTSSFPPQATGTLHGERGQRRELGMRPTWPRTWALKGLRVPMWRAGQRGVHRKLGLSQENRLHPELGCTLSRNAGEEAGGGGSWEGPRSSPEFSPGVHSHRQSPKEVKNNIWSLSKNKQGGGEREQTASVTQLLRSIWSWGVRRLGETEKDGNGSWVP